jgi:hypothetical protein
LHAGVQPFLDEPYDAPISDPMFDELHQPCVVDRVEESTDVGVEHPVHAFPMESGRERVQRTMLAASGAKPIREPDEILLVDRVQHLDDRSLDDLVFQRRHSDRPLSAIRLRDEDSSDGLRSVCSSSYPLGKIFEVGLE